MRRQQTKGLVRVLVAAFALIAACAPPDGGGGGPTPGRVHLTIHEGADPGEIGLSDRPMSADGRFVVFHHRESQHDNIRLWDRSTATAADVTQPGTGSTAGLGVPSISADGSAVVFTASGGPMGPGVVADGQEFFRSTTPDGAWTRIAVPDSLSDGPVTGVTVSGDGDTVVLSTGRRVLRWTVSDGFQVLVDDADGTHRVQAASLSANARFLTTLRITPDLSMPSLQRAEYVVRDLAENSIHTTWTGPLWNPSEPPQVPYDFRLGATSDDGGVIFSYVAGGPVLQLAGTGALAGGSLTGASWNGRYYSYTGNPELVPVQEAGASFVHDRSTWQLTRVSGFGTPTATQARAVSDDGRYVLLFSSDSAVVASPGYHLWDRAP